MSRPAFVADDPRFAALVERLAAGDPVRRIDTHGAAVFLAGGRAYKVKRPVAFPYMDLSTPARRRAACAAELRLNRRTAPALYLGLAALREEGDAFALGPLRDEPPDEGECVVVMRRFDEATLFDRMAERGALPADLAVRLGEAVARLHASAEVFTDRGGADAMRWVAEENLGELEAAADVLGRDAVAQLGARTRAAMARLAPTLDRRRDAGFVRHCHGDLHLRNVCLVDGEPTLFDALEFDAALAITDTMYDLAYVLMDLLHRGLTAQACALLNRYLERSGDYAGLAGVRFFMSVRAAVRAKVSLSTAAVQDAPAKKASLVEDARRYLDDALRHLDSAQPAVVAVGGLSGSGKSTVARALAPRLGPAPGAVVLRSDVIRKRLMGADDLDRLGPAGYRGAVSRRVYAALVKRARTVVEAGHSIVADATFLRASTRADLERTAHRAAAPFLGVWLETDEKTLVARIAGRRDDPSDATAEIVRRQLEEDTGPVAWTRIDAALPPDAIAARVAALLAGRDGT